MTRRDCLWALFVAPFLPLLTALPTPEASGLDLLEGKNVITFRTSGTVGADGVTVWTWEQP